MRTKQLKTMLNKILHFTTLIGIACIGLFPIYLIISKGNPLYGLILFVSLPIAVLIFGIYDKLK